MQDTPWTTAPHEDTVTHTSDLHASSVESVSTSKARIVVARRVHVRTITVAKVPVVKLPPIDDKLKHKIRAHMVCVVISGFVLMVASFATDGLLAHVLPFMSVAPNGIMEALDRLHDR